MLNFLLLGKTLVSKENAIRMAKKVQVALSNPSCDGENIAAEAELPGSTGHYSNQSPKITNEGEDATYELNVSEGSGYIEDDEIEQLSLEKIFEDHEHEDQTDENSQIVEQTESEEDSYMSSETEQENVSGIKGPTVYFLSLVATDANDRMGKGMPRKAYYFFDVKSEMELQALGVKFLSAQDLALFYETNKSQEDSEVRPNIYQLVVFFLAHHPNDIYFVDEAPVLKGNFSGRY